jgi:hypothetical protein
LIGNYFKISDSKKGLSPVSAPIPSTAIPDQLVEHSEQWFLENANYILGFYNQPSTNINTVGTPQSNCDSPVTTMLKNLAFLNGEQSWGMYNYLVTLTPNSKWFWIKNRKIPTIMDKMKGAINGRMAKAIIGADPLSPDAKSKRLDKINLEMFKFLVKPLLKDKSDFKVQDTEKPFQNTEEIEEWGDIGIKDHLAECYIAIAEHLFKSRRVPDVTEFVFIYAVACGLGAVEHLVDNGQYYMVWHPAYNIIYDNRIDSRNGEDDRFIAVVDNMTVTELFSKYTFLPQDVREDIMKLAKDRDTMTSFNQGSNIQWWANNPTLPPNYKDVALSVVRFYFFAPDEEDPTLDSCYTCEIIGNRYLVNYGKCNNMVERLYGTYKYMLPLQKFTPDMILGNLNALFSRITDLSLEADMYRAKVRQLISRSKGKIHVFRSSKLNSQGNNIQKIEEQMTDLGIVLLEDTGDPNLDDRIKLSEMVDCTLDPNIKGLLEVIQLVESEMEAFVNQTKISMGEQTKYVGSKTFSGSLEQSALGTAGLYDGIMNFMSIQMRIGVNIVKNLYAEGYNDFEARAVLGDTNLELLKKSKDKNMEEYLIWLGIKDEISSEQKATVEKLAIQGIAQPQTLKHMKSIVKVLFSKTKSAAIEELESMAAKITKEEEASAQAANQERLQTMQFEQSHEDKQLAASLSNKQMLKDKDITIKEQKLKIDELKVQLQAAKQNE